MAMNKRIFLDYASTTPTDKRVIRAMVPYFAGAFGNPSALYAEGLAAKAAVKDARKTIAELLNVRTDEIIFTASGTEADNLAVRGVFEAFRAKFVPHIITTAIEHPGILEICREIERLGGEVSYVSVEKNGIVDPKKIAAALKPSTVLVSVMLANNEIGTIQPLREIRRAIDEYQKSSRLNLAARFNLDDPALLPIPYLHTDASQAGNYLDVSFQKLGVDMMTLDASKIYGPKGIGLLAARKHVALKPVILGGGQEKGLRSGTENVPGIVGFAEALRIAQSMREKESDRLGELRDYFFAAVIKEFSGVYINGDMKMRLPNNINICIPKIDAEFAVIQLDQKGIAASAASSCQSLSENPFSYVVAALPEHGEGCKGSSLRFTLGRNTAKKQIDLTLRAIDSIIIKQ